MLPALDAFRLQLKGLLRVLLASEVRPLHHIESRCKGVEGFREKTTRKSYDDPLQQMTDMVGLRIIMYFNSDVTFAAGLIQSEFVIDPENSEDKRIPRESDRFGYGSYHLVVSLNERRSALREWQPFKGMKAEIQIRTVLQHTWAAVDHLLDYKKDQHPGGAPVLNRTDWILLFLGADSGPYPSDQVRVMKGLFFLSQIPSQPLSSQYHFEAYDSGPTDPMVYRDLDALQLAGLVGVQRTLGSTRKIYDLTDQGRQRFAALRNRVLPTQYEEIEAIKRRVSSQTIDDLLEQIFLEFPDYAYRNVARMAN